jgi:serine/threonine protein kinase
LALTPGTRLGVYEVTALIGEGGMGQVHRATDTKLKRQVAIKVLPPSLASDRSRLARFQREAEILVSLNHPNIAAIYGFENEGEGDALVLELVEGRTLAVKLEGQKIGGTRRDRQRATPVLVKCCEPARIVDVDSEISAIVSVAIACYY